MLGGQHVRHPVVGGSPQPDLRDVVLGGEHLLQGHRAPRHLVLAQHGVDDRCSRAWRPGRRRRSCPSPPAVVAGRGSPGGAAARRRWRRAGGDSPRSGRARRGSRARSSPGRRISTVATSRSVGRAQGVEWPSTPAMRTPTAVRMHFSQRPQLYAPPRFSCAHPQVLAGRGVGGKRPQLLDPRRIGAVMDAARPARAPRGVEQRVRAEGIEPGVGRGGRHVHRSRTTAPAGGRPQRGWHRGTRPR